jgi:hypothetical protein
MILTDTVKDLITTMDVFMTKKGHDSEISKQIVNLINQMNGEDSLDKIYVNEIDNFNIPDVVVLPLYNRNFNSFLLTDQYQTCPFGYTVEIHSRCFTTYTAEELVAVIIHDILQNIQSCSAKTRFMKAYNYAMNKYTMEHILDVFDGISSSEVGFMGFIDICCRPFRVPVMTHDYIGTDEVLKNMNLGDAYDSYLNKVMDGTRNFINMDSSNNSPEARIETEVKRDFQTMKTIFMSVMDKDIRHYYQMIRDGVPLLSLEYLTARSSASDALGFADRRKTFRRRLDTIRKDTTGTSAIVESFINPKNEIELRFQVDKIIADMRYAETEAEREVILIKIKNLAIKLTKQKIDLEKKYKKNPQDTNTRNKLEYVQNYLDELDMLRDKVTHMEIKQRRYGLFVAYPENYVEDRPIQSWYENENW